MGVNTRPRGKNKIFFNIFGGELVIQKLKKEDLIKDLEQLNQPIDDINERVVSKGKHEGKTMYYCEFDDVVGFVDNIALHEGGHGEFVTIDLKDVDQVLSVSLGDVFGRHVKDFIRRMEAIDFSLELTIGTWSMSGENDRTHSGVRLYQEDELIKYVHERESLPPPVKKTRGKTEEWDFSEQEEYLYSILEDYINKNFPEKKQTSQEKPAPPSEPEADPAESAPQKKTRKSTKAKAKPPAEKDKASETPSGDLETIDVTEQEDHNDLPWENEED